MKKFFNFLYVQQWKGVFNYVVKCYIEFVDWDVYFEDVCLQMEVKFWGEEYNWYKFFKQVDIMQMCIIELKDRLGKFFFYLEYYIEGKYIKYNFNFGFVCDDNICLMLQVFSYFIFECFGYQLIVVDIQGVGDFYMTYRFIWRWVLILEMVIQVFVGWCFFFIFMFVIGFVRVWVLFFLIL